MYSKRIQKKVKDDYNQIADEFSISRRFPWEEFELFTPYLRENTTILDLGCGNGRLLTYLADKLKKFEYLGVDQSENLIKHAKKIHPKYKFVCEDMTDFAVKNDFDTVFMIASFHHLPPSVHLKVLENLYFSLKKDGYLFMTNWNLYQMRFSGNWLKTLLFPRFGLKGLLIPWHNRVKRYYYAFTLRELEKKLQKAGFKILLKQGGKNLTLIAQK